MAKQPVKAHDEHFGALNLPRLARPHLRGRSNPERSENSGQAGGGVRRRTGKGLAGCREKVHPVAGRSPNNLTNTNVEDELRLRAEKAGAGKLGGQAKAGKNLAGARQKKNETDTQSETEKENDKHTHSLTRVLSGREEGLRDQFLDAYPKKTHQERAKVAYAAIINSESEHDELMAGVARWAHSEQWFHSMTEDGGRFIPDADKFLSAKMWKEEPPVKPEKPFDALKILDKATRQSKRRQ